MYRDDIRFFTSHCWPAASEDRLHVLAKFTTWLGLLDEFIETLPRPLPAAIFVRELSARLFDLIVNEAYSVPTGTSKEGAPEMFVRCFEADMKPILATLRTIGERARPQAASTTIHTPER
jgi:hypothetical protein